MEHDLKTLITHLNLRRMAGEKAFDKGVGYYEGGNVGRLVIRKGSVSAKVEGTDVYRSKLWTDAETGGLNYSCTCPVGQDGGFCKHSVALGLTWIEKHSEDRNKGPAVSDIPGWLAGLNKERLIKIILDQAEDDDYFFEWLELQSSMFTAEGGIDVERIKVLLSNTIRVNGFVDYNDAYTYAQGVEKTVEGLEQLLEEGHFAEVSELAEHAVHELEVALEHIDDQDGSLGNIIADLMGLHHDACKESGKDAKELARMLFSWEAGSDIFSDAVWAYSDILGKEGLKEYRALLEAEWEKVPQLTPHDRKQGDDAVTAAPGRFRLTSMMESLALQLGDRGLLLSVKRRDLSYPGAFLDIAVILKDAGCIDDAVSWAEQGIAEFPDELNQSLADLLTDLYHLRGEHGKALDLIWKSYSRRPTLERYRALKKSAEEAGGWPVWRDKAIELIRESIRTERSDKVLWWWGPGMGKSLLVEIFLEEKDIEKAWQEARSGGCKRELLLRLADLRSRTRPEDSLNVYCQEVDRVLTRTDRNAYLEAVRLLEKIRSLMIRLKGRDAFLFYLQTIRAAHKRKRSFIELLDNKRLDRI